MNDMTQLVATLRRALDSVTSWERRPGPEYPEKPSVPVFTYSAITEDWQFLLIAVHAKEGWIVDGTATNAKERQVVHLPKHLAQRAHEHAEFLRERDRLRERYAIAMARAFAPAKLLDVVAFLLRGLDSLQLDPRTAGEVLALVITLDRLLDEDRTDAAEQGRHEE